MPTLMPCPCNENECAAAKCADCDTFHHRPLFALKKKIGDIHGSHHVGDAQHTKLHQIYNELDLLYTPKGNQ